MPRQTAYQPHRSFPQPAVLMPQEGRTALHHCLKKIFLLFCLIISAAWISAQSSFATDSDSLPRDTAAASVLEDSLSADSDSVIGRLARQGSVRPLDLPEQKPETVFSVRNISYVLIVIGLLILFLHLLRKFVSGPMSSVQGGPEFQMLRQYHLGQKRSVALVRFFNRLLLVGISESGMSTLAEISDPEEVEALLAEFKEKKSGQEGNFRDIYQGLLSRMRK